MGTWCPGGHLYLGSVSGHKAEDPDSGDLAHHSSVIVRGGVLCWTHSAALHAPICASAAPSSPWHWAQLALIMQTGLGIGLDSVSLHLAPQGLHGPGKTAPDLGQRGWKGRHTLLLEPSWQPFCWLAGCVSVCVSIRLQ